MPSCSPNFNYFDSPDFLITSLHLITIISTPIYILGIYCILFKTPDQMKSVKPYLLNFHFLIISLDYLSAILTIPYVLIPELAGIPYGLLRYLGVPTSIQTAIAVIVLGFMMIAMISIYENRFFILCEFRYKKFWAYGRKVWLISHHLIVIFMCISILLGVPDQEKARESVIKNLPCLPDYLRHEPIFVLAQNYNLLSYLALAIVITICLETGFFITQLIRNINKQLKSKTISEKTFQMHKQFFKALVSQLTIPTLMIIFPYSYALGTVFLGYTNQAVINCVVISVTTHGFVSTVVMIIVHHPYRLAVKEIFGKAVNRPSTVASMK